MDGIQEIHDRNRKDAGGKETFKKVLKNARFLQNAGVNVNISVSLQNRAQERSVLYTIF